MNLRQGFAWWSFSEKGVEAADLLKAAKRIGYEGVDLLDESLWPVARDLGLQLSAIRGHETFGLNRRENAKAIEEEILRNLEKARQWNIPILLCFSGNREGQDDETGLRICAETLSRLAPAAEAARVTLALEGLNSKVDHLDYQADTTGFSVRVCELVDSSAMKILYDIYHMQIMEGDIIRTIQKHHRWFAHYHTAGNPGRGQPDATQELNYPAIYRAIRDTGYAGCVVHEFLPKGDPIAALQRAYTDLAEA